MSMRFPETENEKERRGTNQDTAVIDMQEFRRSRRIVAYDAELARWRLIVEERSIRKSDVPE